MRMCQCVCTLRVIGNDQDQPVEYLDLNHVLSSRRALVAADGSSSTKDISESSLTLPAILPPSTMNRLPMNRGSLAVRLTGDRRHELLIVYGRDSSYYGGYNPVPSVITRLTVISYNMTTKEINARDSQLSNGWPGAPAIALDTAMGDVYLFDTESNHHQRYDSKRQRWYSFNAPMTKRRPRSGAAVYIPSLNGFIITSGDNYSLEYYSIVDESFIAIPISRWRLPVLTFDYTLHYMADEQLLVMTPSSTLDGLLPPAYVIDLSSYYTIDDLIGSTKGSSGGQSLKWCALPLLPDARPANPLASTIISL